MTSDEFLADLAAVYARGPVGEAFGSGRLIAPGLVLTAGHVVDYPTRQEPLRAGWKVCLVSERSESGAWVNPARDAELVWRGSGDLDLALLRLVGATTCVPKVQPLFASWNVRGSINNVDAAGFPQAARKTNEIRDYTLSGLLRISSQHGPYAWTVPPGDKPDSRDGWKGMSGGAACKVGPDGQLHVLGVLEAVPANFSGGRLEVARLSAAFADEAFRNELRVSLECEPRIVPWKEHNDPTGQAPTRTPVRSTIPALRIPFVGRKDLLKGIGTSLGDPFRNSVIVLRGPAGVGKSELALEFARRHQHAYPGGTFLLDGGGPLLAMGLARLGQIAFHSFPAQLTIEDQGVWTLNALGTAPTLLIYDNVQSEEAVQAWLPPAGIACHVIMTTLLDWPAGWPASDVKTIIRSGVGRSH